MARGTVTADEIAMVRAALMRLRGLKPFRGQSALVRDAEEQLANLLAASGRACLDQETRARQALQQRGADI